MKVLIVCEDPTHDRYVVEPVVARLLTDLGAKARTEVLADPHLRGVDDLLDNFLRIVADNPMIDLFVVVIDRDGNRRNNVERLDNAVLQLNKNASPGKLVGCCAIEEVEAWLLALHRDALPNPWPVVRQDCDVKERHALPFLRQRGNGGPGRVARKPCGNSGEAGAVCSSCATRSLCCAGTSRCRCRGCAEHRLSPLT